MAHDVFVSYSHADQECALGVVSRIEAQGLSVWMAPRDIAPSSDWAASIVDAISSARLMVLVFSSHSNASPQVLREVERAVHKRVPVLPLRIEDVAPTKSLEYFISTQHWLDAFTLPREPHYERLCAHVSALLGGASSGTLSGEPSRRQDSAPNASSPAPARVVPAFNPSATELQSLERNLAHHVGPVAKHLVKRALVAASGWDDLTRRLAAEVAPDLARREFIDACGAFARPRD